MSSSGSYATCLADLATAAAGDAGDAATAAPSGDALLRCVAAAADARDARADAALDAFFLLYAATLVFFMQTGFAMLCAGCVRSNNVMNTLLKNLLDACGASLGFYTVGYAFAFGGSGDAGPTTFIGGEHFFLVGVENDSFWLFQFAFCATSATIVAGTLAERCQMCAYLAYSIMLAAFVYPVVVHSIWSARGFLSVHNAAPLWGSGMVDFAGGAVVHLTGGTTALIATRILGSRTGRFYDLRGRPLATPAEFPGHSLALQCLGTFVLWFGWYGFNAGSVLSLTRDDRYLVASHTAINTALSAAAGAVVALFLSTVVAEHYTGEVTFNLQYAMNGCLSGLVAITAGCAVVESWASIVIGLVAGALYLACSKLLVRWRLDDAVDAIPVHMVNGVWGSLSVGLFAEPELMRAMYPDSTHAGWFYNWGRGSADATLLACQAVGILFVIGWVLGTMAPFFWLLHYFGFLRSDSLEEVVGLDIGYAGNSRHRDSRNRELQNQMDAYMEEYEHRQRERRHFKRQGRGGGGGGARAGIPASSTHSHRLHGDRHHGRRILVDPLSDSHDLRIEQRIASALANDAAAGDGRGAGGGDDAAVGDGPGAPGDAAVGDGGGAPGDAA